MYWNYVLIGYVVVFGGLGLYAVSLLRRGRNLAEQVEPDRRRFLD
ncbi:MAG: hypothetical protein O3C27_03215 [Actinomycetota bacterium]|nr:hypothetical protein [Actinomycetota bacterium]